MQSILDKIEQLEREHDKPDPGLLRKHNIKLGLRNADGSGVVVGLTSKGQVIGYKKERAGAGSVDFSALSGMRIPGLEPGTPVTQNLALYYLLNGRVPDAETLAQFESRLPDYQETVARPVEGALYYCGYDVVTLIEHMRRENRFGFDEVTYLLLTGELPAQADLASFSAELARRRELPKAAQRLIMQDSANADQMGALHRAVSAMSLFDPHPTPSSLRDITRQCIDLIAKVPTIVAYNYQALAFTRGQAKGLLQPRADLSTAENFLYMVNGKTPTALQARLMDLCLILHAEHGGGNNSTFAVRVVSSSQANTYMALSTGIASLSGHLHGGANEAVVKMMQFVKDTVKDWKDDAEIEACLSKILNKEAHDRTGKLYGIGHAVYTLSDPRAIVLEKQAAELAKESGRKDEFVLYQKAAAIGSEIVFRQKGKRVAPNVDFYSGFVYDMLGIPIELYTPIFALARMAGWSAHRLEQLLQSRILRPAYVSSIPKVKDYTPLSQRK